MTPYLIKYYYFCGMEPTAYNVTLVIGVMVNGFAGLLLLLQSFFEGDHPSYRRALVYSAVVQWLFAAGFVLHVHFQWRYDQPLLASALALTYLHLGMAIFSWAYIGLVDPFYHTWKIYVRDLVIVACAVPCNWLTTTDMPTHYLGYVICGVHCCFLASTFYWKYYHMSEHLAEVSPDPDIRLRTRFIVNSVHFMNGFGLLAILVSALWQDEKWPYTLLMVASSVVFIYLAMMLLLYHDVVEKTGNAIDDVAESQRNPGYARFIRRVMGRKSDVNDVNQTSIS